MLAGSEGDHRPHVSRIPHPPPRRPRTRSSSRTRACHHTLGLRGRCRGDWDRDRSCRPLLPGPQLHRWRQRHPIGDQRQRGLGDLRRHFFWLRRHPSGGYSHRGRGILLALGGPFSGTVSGTVGSPAPGQDGWVVSLHLLRRQPRADATIADDSGLPGRAGQHPVTTTPTTNTERPLPSRTTPPTPSLGFSHWRVWGTTVTLAVRPAGGLEVTRQPAASAPTRT